MAQPKVKRLKPTPETLRKLYLLSGNVCAFPKCDRVIIDHGGNFVGQLCHIEAAEEGGQRFNKHSTNEARRRFENLMLMCYEHHVETNNVAKYPAPKLREMKRRHEAKFSGLIAQIQKKFVDQTKLVEPSGLKSLNRMDKALGWKLSDYERAQATADLSELVAVLKRVPLNTRQIFATIIERAEPHGTELRVPYHDISEALSSLPEHELKKHIQLLEQKYNLVDVDVGDEYGPMIKTWTPTKTEWGFWAELKTFSEKETIDLDDIIVRLDFGVLD